MRLFVLLAFIFTLTFASAALTQAERLQSYSQVLGSLITHPEHNAENVNLVHEFFEAMHLQDFSSSRAKPLSMSSIAPNICSGCKVFFKFLQYADAQLVKYAENIFIEQGVAQCLSKFGYTDEVCRVYSVDMSKYIVNNIQQRFFDPDFACPLISVCPPVYELVSVDLLVSEILNEKVPADLPAPKKPSNEAVKVLHITDIHMDPGYLENMPATCNYPICCRNNHPYNETETTSQSQQPQTENAVNQTQQLSGYWGTPGRCDLPERTFNQFVEFIARNISSEVDFVIWTGDNVSHDQSNISLSRSLNITSYISSKFKKELSIPVIGSFGNNDAAPDYIYDFMGGKNTQFQDKISSIWKEWLDASAYLKIQEHGFFATRIPHLPNLKVISLNTFACVEKNYFLLRNSTDPGNQLEWLRNELRQSELIGERVHIIGHIPMMFCSEKWARVYQAIVQRFQNTIAGQFFGHTHSDQYSLITAAKNPKKNIGVQYIAPSLTTIGVRNPSFRVYSVDSATYEVLDYDQYRLDIAKYNALGPLVDHLEWEKAYSFKAEYNLTDLSLASLSALADNLSTLNPTYSALQRNYITSYNDTSVTTTYNNALYCATTTPLLEELATCRGVEPYSSTENMVFHVIDSIWQRKITKKTTDTNDA